MIAASIGNAAGSMRIVNVGDFNWMTGRERDSANVDLFAIRQKLSRAAIRAGHMVVEFSDRAVSRTSAPLRLQGLGRTASNRAFLNLIEEVRPDLLLLNFADDITNASLVEARRLSPGLVIADINIDPLPDPKTRRRLEMRQGMADATFVTTAGPALEAFAGPRSFVAFMPNPVDTAVETGRVFEAHGAAVDLIFPAGDDSLRAIGRASIRPSEAVARLRAAAPELRLASPGLGAPRLRGRAYLEALEGARMGWSLSRHNDQPLYASDRMAHMLGSGLLTFVDRRTGFERIYGPDEVAFYDGLDDLARQAAAFSQDDARLRDVARRGWMRTWAAFEAGRVFDYLLTQLSAEGGASDQPWPCERWPTTRRPGRAASASVAAHSGSSQITRA